MMRDGGLLFWATLYIHCASKNVITLIVNNLAH